MRSNALRALIKDLMFVAISNKGEFTPLEILLTSNLITSAQIRYWQGSNGIAFEDVCGRDFVEIVSAVKFMKRYADSHYYYATVDYPMRRLTYTNRRTTDIDVLFTKKYVKSDRNTRALPSQKPLNEVGPVSYLTDKKTLMFWVYLLYFCNVAIINMGLMVLG
ncbi:hypothetical protein FACS1894184_20690 [Clostridia bacterium]|nr:hypothetical protein FACS1894184_20690 [Clostridia bacterium]